MTNLNRITLLGNTGKHEPKYGSTPAGKQVTRLTLCTNRRFKNEADEWQTKAVWHNVVVYGPSAEYASKIEPGSLVFVEGEMTYREYERQLDTPKGSVKVKWPIAEINATSISAIRTTQQKGATAAA